MELISLAAWAARVGVSSSTARRWAQRNQLAGAVKIGRNWLVPQNAGVPDIRRGNPNIATLRRTESVQSPT